MLPDPMHPPAPRGHVLYIGAGFPRSQEKTVSNIPTLVVTKWVPFPPNLVKPGFLSARDVVRQRFQEEEKRRPILPNHTVQRSSAALYFIQDPPRPPSPDRGIFSEAENPSHDLSSSTEVIKHGWFVVIDVVLLPWTDPQTLESTPMIKTKKVWKLLVFCMYEGKKMPIISCSWIWMHTSGGGLKCINI